MADEQRSEVESTPRGSEGSSSGPRGAIDVARVLALLLVVLGHLLLAVIDRHDGEVRGANLLVLHPGWSAVAALAPMPVFFAAAGWANAASTPAASAARLRTLVGLGAVIVCAWSAGVIATRLVAGYPGVVGDGARIATQPLWFVARSAPPVAPQIVLAVLVAAAAGAAVALRGPRTAAWALGCSGLFAAAWWLLRPSARRAA